MRQIDGSPNGHPEIRALLVSGSPCSNPASESDKAGWLASDTIRELFSRARFISRICLICNLNMGFRVAQPRQYREVNPV